MGPFKAGERGPGAVFPPRSYTEVAGGRSIQSTLMRDLDSCEWHAETVRNPLLSGLAEHTGGVSNQHFQFVISPSGDG